MELELFTKQLEDITDRIHQLELKEVQEDNKKNFWGQQPPITKKTILERKSSWTILKKDLEKKIDFINKTLSLNSNQEEKKQLFLLIDKFSNKLSLLEEKVAKLEIDLVELESKEEQLKKQSQNWIIVVVLSFLLIGGYYLYKEHKNNNKGFFDRLSED